jgi:hypothetical protein
VLAEFGGESLGDVRLDERLRRVVSLAVMDQEAADYDLFAALEQARRCDVILASPTRQATEAKRDVKAALARQPGIVFRTVPLSLRGPRKTVQTQGRRPARVERTATLQVRWGTVTLPRRQYNEATVRTLTL